MMVVVDDHMADLAIYQPRGEEDKEPLENMELAWRD